MNATAGGYPKDSFFMENGCVLSVDRFDGLRRSLWAVAQNMLFGLADTIGSMQCEGFLHDEKAIREAIQQLYDRLQEEAKYEVHPVVESGRFDLVERDA